MKICGILPFNAVEVRRHPDHIAIGANVFKMIDTASTDHSFQYCMLLRSYPYPRKDSNLHMAGVYSVDAGIRTTIILYFLFLQILGENWSRSRISRCSRIIACHYEILGHHTYGLALVGWFKWSNVSMNNRCH